MWISKWWKPRTRMEKCLVWTTCITILIGLSFLIAFAVIVSKGNNAAGAKSETDTCLTPECIHTASAIINNMDRSVDPCKDFYNFTCGNFVKSTNIPDHKSSVTTFDLIEDELQAQLRFVIEEPTTENEPKPFKLVKKLYKACMNVSLIEKEGLKAIHKILKDAGGWPVLEGDNWIEGDFDWKNSTYKLKRSGFGVNYFITFSVMMDMKNNSKRIIYLDQPTLGLQREFLIKGLSDKIVQSYSDYMVDIAVLFGANKEKAQKELNESLALEMELANISLSSEERRDASLLYNPTSLGELQKKYPSIPWEEYINNFLAPDNKLNKDGMVIVLVPKYLSDFEALINRTPERIQANYVMWRAASSSVSYLTEDLRKRKLEYTTILNGKTEREPRWKECIHLTAGSLSHAAGALYVRKYFNENARRNAKEMVADIRTEFNSILAHIDWMDDETRKNAIDKANSMSTHIAYPDELLDDKKLEQFHEGLELDENYYLRSILNLTLFGTRYSFRLLREPVNKTDWVTHGIPTVVNAFYSPLENSIQLPAGILQGLFFNADRPRYMNYGAIGFVIGHEITHGFDDQGRQFDKNGNLVNWWAPQTLKAYLEKAQCIIDQYENYTVPELGIHLHGINTQGENIADNGGIKEAYLAYNNWVKRHGPEPKLPGLPFTPNQLFWVSAANTWCSKYRPESMKSLVLTGYHSPGYFRVIGPMSNLEYFAKDFNCPVGTKMNPRKKCQVW